MALLYALLLGARLFHVETIATFADSRHTHVEVTGQVTRVRRERDGDVHFTLADRGGHWIVCEIVPYHPLPVPRRGSRVTVRGIRRFDDEVRHLWWELHPVETWELAR